MVPLATIVFGASVVGSIPRMIVAGVLVYVGLSFLVAWIVDVRRSLPLGEYVIILAIVATIALAGSHWVRAPYIQRIIIQLGD